MSGYWDKEFSAVLCTIDTNDRFHLGDDAESLTKLQKSVDFYACENGVWNCLFLKQGDDGAVYFNDRVVFTKDELKLFSSDIIYINEDNEKQNEHELAVISCKDINVFTLDELNIIIDKCINPKQVNIQPNRV